MAYKHVRDYYFQIQSEYLEEVSNIKDFEEGVKGGFLTQEQFEQAQQMLAQAKANYERLSYIMYLLDKPKYNWKGYDKKHSKLIQFFKEVKADKESVSKENKDIFNNLKKYLEECK